MKDTVTLVKREYSSNGTTFEKIFQKSIENYVKNMYYNAEQTLENRIKCN